MIPLTRAAAIDRAIAYLCAGHPVAYAVGLPQDAATALRGIAAGLDGALYDTDSGRVEYGALTVVPRVPFMPGGGLHGWHGAIVLDPGVSRILYGRRAGALLDLINETHRKAGVA